MILCLGLLPMTVWAEETEQEAQAPEEPVPQADTDSEVKYRLDNSGDWTDASLFDALWAGYTATNKVEIQLNRDIILTEENWSATPAIDLVPSWSIDGGGHTIFLQRTGCQVFSVQAAQARDKTARVTLTLRNVTIDGGAVWSGDDPATRTNTGLSHTSNSDRLAVVETGATLVLDQGAVLQNNHHTGEGSYGAAVFVWNGGKLIMREGSAIRNSAAYSGGGVYIGASDAAVFQMQGGEITGNFAGNNGGGVCVGDSGTFEMSGGSVTGNQSTAGGGGISAFSGTAKLTGGSVSGNSISGSMGGGVLVYNGSLTVSGGLTVENNTGANGAANNVFLNGKTIAVDPSLSSGARIGVTTSAVPTEGSPVAVTSGAADKQYFFSDSLLYEVVNDSNGIVQLSYVGPCTVTFSAGEGVTAPPSAKTNGQGKLDTLPEATREGHTFDGWYAEETGGDKITTDTVFDQDTTVYAHWLINRTVTFESEGSEPMAQTVGDGRTVSKPADPAREGYAFLGWYAEGSDTAFDFTAPITGDLTLTARWVRSVTGVVLDPSSLSLNVGETAALIATVSPDDAANRTVSWSSGDPTVAEVDSTGKVTAKRAGSTTITVTTADGGKTATCAVTVIGSSSSGGSGSSSSSTPKLPVTTDTVTQSGVPTTETTATPTASTRGGKAEVTVNTSMGNEIVKQAVANGSEAVIIAPKVFGIVTQTTVSIPAATVGQIGSQTGASLTVSTPVADVTIPNGGLGSLSSVGGTITVAAEKVGNTVELSVTAGGRTVTSVPGGLTLTVPVSDTVPGTVAVLVNEDGTRNVVRKSAVCSAGITIPLDGSARLEIVDNSKYFYDVPSNGWVADAVAFASSHELFNGTDVNQFSPNSSMSRGMLVVVLYNLENNPMQPLTGMFADVNGNEWYAEGVAWAAASGIVNSYSEEKFGPDDNITREQLAVMLWRYADSPTATDGRLDFADEDEISDWAVEALRWATENGVIYGKEGGILDPRGYATRAEAAQILKNFLERQ